MTPRWAARALLLLGLLITTSWTGVAMAVQVEMPAPKGPAMWRLQTDGATVYFLGSFHILPPRLNWRDARVDEALAAADGVVFEVDLSEMDKPEVAQMIARRAMLPDGGRLSEVLSAETYAHLTRVTASLSMPMATIERAQPWFAATGLLVGYMMREGASPEDGVDSQLTREARAAGKRIIPLETVEGQFDVLESLSKEDPDFLVMDTIRFIEDPKGLLAHMLDAWTSGDEKAVDRMMRADLDKYDGAYNRFIADRNAAWVPQIEGLIKKGGTYFVVVGAGHLVGDRSVISLLEKRGYVIERY
jgi:uncharacterized protein YbaP (TraB family)